MRKQPNKQQENMKLYNLVRTEIGNDGKMKEQTVIASTDEESAKRLLEGLTFGKAIPDRNGNRITWEFSDSTIVMQLVESGLILGKQSHTEEISELYNAYIDLLVSRLKQWGEKEVSKMGDIVYRLDITEMDFYATNYEENNEQEWRIAEIVLNQNSAGNFIDLITLGGEKRFSLIRTELRNIENLANFIDKLTKFMSNTKN